MSGCSGNCSSCGSDCADRKAESLLAAPNPKSNVKKVIMPSNELIHLKYNKNQSLFKM